MWNFRSAQQIELVLCVMMVRMRESKTQKILLYVSQSGVQIEL
jgi:hypothetical protein